MNASERSAPPRVVVVGAGMAGLATVRALSRAPVTVQLIDAHNYTSFPPLLFRSPPASSRRQRSHGRSGRS